MTFPQRSQRVGVIEGDATLLKVKGHTEPGRQRVGEACGRGGAVADGVAGAVPVVTVVVLVVVVVLGQVDLTHPHSEEAERWSRVQGVLRPAVMTAVWVVAAERESSMNEDVNNHCNESSPDTSFLISIHYYIG